MSCFEIDPFGKEIMCRLVKVMMVLDDKVDAGVEKACEGYGVT